MATSPTKYYTMILLLMVMNGTLNMIFYISFKADVCQIEALTTPTVVKARVLLMAERGLQIQNPSTNPQSTQTTPANTTNNATSPNSTTSTANGSATSSTVKKDISFSLVHLPLSIAVFYFFLLLLNVILIAGYGFFANQLSMQYQDIGLFKNILGMVVKMMPSLIKFFHYVIFFLICGQWAAIFTESACKTAPHVDFYNRIYVGKMWSESRIYNSFTSFLWIVLNCFCPFVRKRVYFANFLYKPLNRRVSWFRRCLFESLGP